MELTRKQFLQVTAAGAAAQPSHLSPPLAPARKPNVLIIMTDQHGRNYIENTLVPTPNIDRIAARGVRFTNAISGLRRITRVLTHWTAPAYHWRHQ
jgi:hypothetical protein